jgi:hypothetical protein
LRNAFVNIDNSTIENELLSINYNLWISYFWSNDTTWIVDDAPFELVTQQLTKEEEIYSDAAVLIETSAGIWDNLPPGAADLLNDVEAVVKG